MEVAWITDLLQDKDRLKEYYLQDCHIRGMTASTIENYKSILRTFYVFLDGNNASLEDIDKNTMRDFIAYLQDERKVSLKRIANYFAALSSFWDYLIYEDLAEFNIPLSVRKRYLRSYKKKSHPQAERKLISVEDMALLVNRTLSTRSRAIIVLLAKTGIRRGELMQIDIQDIDWAEQSITLKPKPKRSNRVVFFDDECARVLKRWVVVREKNFPNNPALFPGKKKQRICRNTVLRAVVDPATRIGIHNPNSKRLEDRFTPHCCRHWFTTHLRRAGMPREFIQELRGDERREAIDIYDHIDKEELRRSYLSCIPQLGI